VLGDMTWWLGGRLETLAHTIVHWDSGKIKSAALEFWSTS